MVAENSEAKMKGKQEHTMEEGHEEVRGNRSMERQIPRQERSKKVEGWKIIFSTFL